MAFLLTALPFMAFLGLVLLAAAALLAFFWPSVEWWLLAQLMRRRREREARLLRAPRPALRRPR